MQETTWFTKQLEAAARAAQEWPDWVRREAGLHTISAPQPASTSAPASTPIQSAPDASPVADK